MVGQLILYADAVGPIAWSKLSNPNPPSARNLLRRKLGVSGAQQLILFWDPEHYCGSPPNGVRFATAGIEAGTIPNLPAVLIAVRPEER